MANKIRNNLTILYRGGRNVATCKENNKPKMIVIFYLLSSGLGGLIDN